MIRGGTQMKPKNKKRNYRGKFNPKSGKPTQSNNLQDRLVNDIETKENGKFPQGKVTIGKDNAPEWYFKDKNVLADVASFSYSNALGRKIYPNRLSDQTAWSNWSGAFPGLMAITLMPTVGISGDSQSPLNLAATNVYSYVRYKNSGAKNYNAPDLMLMLCAMDSIYACWNWMKRLYGVASTYSATNVYKPTAYFRAQAADMGDIVANLASFRAYLNIAADRISAFCVPATMTYMVRHSWLFSNIYKDSNTAKAQEYMYVPAAFYKYNETSSSSGGFLEMVNVLTGVDSNTQVLWNYNSLRNLLDSLIDAINMSEDIGIMSGDILKAYGEGNLFTLSHIEADYKVDAVYSEEVLTQIENASLSLISADDLQNFSITQDPNANILISQPFFAGTLGTSIGTMINFHKDNPTPEDTMVATRLSFTAYTDTAAGQIKYQSFGSELAIDCNIIMMAQSPLVTDEWDPTKPLLLHTFRYAGLLLDLTQPYTMETIMEAIYGTIAFVSFDWAPHIAMAVTDGTINRSFFPLADWDVYTMIENSQMDALNTLALLTEFNVPN